MSRLDIPITSFLILFGLACSSGAPDSPPSEMSEPEIRVRQPEGQFEVMEVGDIDINLQIDVFNGSSEEITLKRVGLRSIPTSDIQFASSGRNLDEAIPPGSVRTVDVWVRATNSSSSLSPSMTVRGTAVFVYSGGTFRTIFTESVVESNMQFRPR
ncbi:MAG: hypothetical protein KY459_01150 [Acidobacteria bacterium]|nr:hypothetical protein [Acidobacteriota bacterium]